MVRDITLGQYYEQNSLIHNLDPRFKLRFTIAYIILTLIDRNLILFGLLTAILLVGIALSNVPFSHMIKGIRGILILVFVCSFISSITSSGDVVLKLGFIKFTDIGLIKSLFVFWRMVMIIFASSLLMYTTTPTRLTDALEKCFHLSGSVAMGITIALRFLSVLSGELRTIVEAQEARGANFHSGGPITRVKKLGTVIVPLFQNSIDRASQLGEAMDARCYSGGKGRTKLHPLKYTGKDLIGYVILLAMIVLCIYLAIVF